MAPILKCKVRLMSYMEEIFDERYPKIGKQVTMRHPRRQVLLPRRPPGTRQLEGLVNTVPGHRADSNKQAADSCKRSNTTRTCHEVSQMPYRTGGEKWAKSFLKCFSILLVCFLLNYYILLTKDYFQYGFLKKLQCLTT